MSLLFLTSGDGEMAVVDTPYARLGIMICYDLDYVRDARKAGRNEVDITSASWMNLVERFFSELTQRQLKRLAVSSVNQLEAAIHAYIEARNQDPTTFVWTASIEHIIEKVDRGNRTLETLH